MATKKKFLQGVRDVIYRLRKHTLKDPLNKGHRARLFTTYLKWYLFYKYWDKKHIIEFQNGYKSYVYPYPDHDAGEANLFTRNVDFIDNQFIRKNLKQGDFIVDAGCNVGNRTWVLADIIGGALLIDPNPIAINRAIENLALNKLNSENFYFIEKGVGEKTATKKFSNYGGASTQNAVIENKNENNAISISITTIDQLLSEIGQIPTFLKIDVEGYDFKALKGAKQTLLSGSVRLIKFENNEKELIDDIKLYFEQLNWYIFALNSQGIPSYSNELILKANNLFAAPKNVDLVY